MYKDYDGKVDAFGVGGLEFYIQVADKRYYMRDVKKVAKAIKISKVGDGNGVKGILEQRAFEALEKHLNKEGKSLKGLPALKTTAVERYGMASAMVDAGMDGRLEESSQRRLTAWVAQRTDVGATPNYDINHDESSQANLEAPFASLENRSDTIVWRPGRFGHLLAAAPQTVLTSQNEHFDLSGLGVKSRFLRPRAAIATCSSAAVTSASLMLTSCRILALRSWTNAALTVRPSRRPASA